MNYGAGIKTTTESRTIQARYYKGVCGRAAELSGVCVPVLTPDRENKRQNGRRFKENGEPMFTLTAQDRHGVAIEPIIMSGNEVTESENICRCLNANDQRKVFGAKQERTMVSVKLEPELIGGIGEINFGKQFRQGNRVYSSDATAMCLNSQPIGNTGGNSYLYSIRTKEKTKQGEGIYVEMPGGFLAYCVWYEKYQCYIAIRKLTPKECFRLQGWSDDYFDRAAFVNSDSQLYKQAGNGVSVPVVKAIGDKIAEFERQRYGGVR